MQVTAKESDVTKYQFEVDDDDWVRWKNTVPRSKSLDERIRELLKADAEGRVGDSRDDRPREQTSSVDTDVGEVSDQDNDVTTNATVDEVVARISDGWEDTDERLQARRAAARAVLQHAVETGDAVGKTQAVNEFLPKYAVEGQNEETWWRKNIRPVLQHVGEYSSGQHGYIVDGLDES